MVEKTKDTKSLRWEKINKKKKKKKKKKNLELSIEGARRMGHGIRLQR